MDAFLEGLRARQGTVVGWGGEEGEIYTPSPLQPVPGGLVESWDGGVQPTDPGPRLLIREGGPSTRAGREGVPVPPPWGEPAVTHWRRAGERWVTWAGDVWAWR